VSGQTVSAADLLDLEPNRAIEQIVDGLRDSVLRELRRRGAVVGLSGGIDSSLVAALCARALGPERVLGLLMPEADSAPDSLELGRLIAASLGIETLVEDITPTLTVFRCYERRDAAIREVIPDYGPGWRSKIVLPPLLGSDRLRTYSVVAESPDGQRVEKRLPASAYLQIVAATNFKQRTRKVLEYFHADRLVYAVAGTPNRIEYDQGFFVKLGDGAADVKPIAHLYKSQVFRLAEHLVVPKEIRSRPPTTDTYSVPKDKTSSTSPSRYRRSTSAWLRATADCRPQRLRRRSASQKRTSSASTPTSTRSVESPTTCTSLRCSSPRSSPRSPQ